MNIQDFDNPLSASEHKITAQNSFELHQNYPNPFNPTTSIVYSLGSPGFVSLKLYDMLGREVKPIVNEHRSAGEHSVVFDATEFASGIYFYRLKSGVFTETKKMLLLR